MIGKLVIVKGYFKRSTTALYCHISLFGFYSEKKYDKKSWKESKFDPHMKKLFLFNSQKGKLRRSKEYRKRDVRSATSTHLQGCQKVWKSWRGEVICRLEQSLSITSSSIISSKVRQIISVIKTQRLVIPEKWCFKNSLFWHFNSWIVLKTTETSLFMFCLQRLFD